MIDELFRGAIVRMDLKTLQLLVHEGVSLSVVNQVEGTLQMNIPMGMLHDEWTEKNLFDVIDLFLDNGLDIDYQDVRGRTLMMHLLRYASERDFQADLVAEGVENRMDLQMVIRLRKTFDKLMGLKPDLTKIRNDSMDVFLYAMNKQCSYWFEPHVQGMDANSRKLYESYRLARLFKEEKM